MIIFTNRITFQWQLMVMSMKIAVKKSDENTENGKKWGKKQQTWFCLFMRFNGKYNKSSARKHWLNNSSPKFRSLWPQIDNGRKISVFREDRGSCFVLYFVSHY